MDRESKPKVILGENRTPERLSWEADESPYPGEHACEAMVFSLWVADRLDIWLIHRSYG